MLMRTYVTSLLNNFYYREILRLSRRNKQERKQIASLWDSSLYLGRGKQQQSR